MIRRDSETVKTLLAWWHDIQPDKRTGYRGDRAAAARLRQARDVFDASMQPATIALCRSLGATVADMANIGLIASVLANLRDNDPTQTIASALGGPDNKSRLCSSLRFQRIVEAADQDAQLIAFRRALALLKHSGHVADLATSLLEWNDPSRRDARRQRWLYDYYHTNNPSTRAEATP